VVVALAIRTPLMYFGRMHSAWQKERPISLEVGTDVIALCSLVLAQKKKQQPGKKRRLFY
jgi:hypothetical protein